MRYKRKNEKLIVKKYEKKYKGFKLLNQPVNLGKGGNVISGMREAKGEIILFTDMDQSTPIEELDKFLPLFDKNVITVPGR